MLKIVNVPDSHEVIGVDESTGMTKVKIPVMKDKVCKGHFVDFIPESVEDMETYRTFWIKRRGQAGYFGTEVSGNRVKLADLVRNGKTEDETVSDILTSADGMSKAAREKLIENLKKGLE